MSRFSYINSVSFTDKGLVRPDNEDAVFMLSEDGVFGVSDGMGGGESGELASTYVNMEITKALSETADESQGLRLTAIRESLLKAHGRIRAYAQENQYEMMGATVALIAFDPWLATVAHVVHAGDSRVYRLRFPVFERLTEDHTVGADIAREIGSGEIANHKTSRLSHVLTRAVGTSDTFSPELTRISVEEGDVFLVCTDGISTMLDDECLKSLLLSAETPEIATSMISDAVRAAGAVDNYSIAICRIAGALPPPESHADEELRESAYLEERWE